MTVGPLQIVLLGRDPDPAQVPWHRLAMPHGWPAELAWPPRTEICLVPLAHAQTSANHLLAICLLDVVALFDLTSLNGSWVELQQSQAVLASPNSDLQVWLGKPARAAQRVPDLVDAEWAHDQQFGEAVADTIQRWLYRHERPVRVSHRRADAPAGALHTPINGTRAILADESVLFLEPQLNCTIPSDLPTLYEKVHAYVSAQNGRYLQLQARHLGMVASAAETRHILLRTADAARREKRVVFLGPTGVGKELLARSYHGYSPCNQGPFVTVNCGQLDRELLYAQLFGAVRGSFTGAVRDVVGLLETADGGTLFLDELGEMSQDVQRSLLRFLDSRGEYYRLGDPKPRRARVQIVCASNLPLSSAGFRARRFRDDLWYRLANVVVQVPPLRERRQDIVAFLSTRYPPDSLLSGWDALSPGAQQWVLAYPWPGNFRELESFVESLPVAAERNTLTPSDCEQLLSTDEPRPPACVPREAVRSSAGALPAFGDPGQSSSPSSPSISALRRLQTEAEPLPNLEFDWTRVMGRALQAFLEDHGPKPACWDQLYLLSEHYLKPLFIAQAAAVADDASARRVNYSAVARQLNIGDGSTVKTHLARFERRFRSTGRDEAAALDGQESA